MSKVYIFKTTGLVVAMKKDRSDGINQAMEFFREEYKLNHMIATCKKPFVSILNGITCIS